MEERRAGGAERMPLFESVGEALKREIASGRFAAADVLPGERELSDMLDGVAHDLAPRDRRPRR